MEGLCHFQPVIDRGTWAWQGTSLNFSFLKTRTFLGMSSWLHEMTSENGTRISVQSAASPTTTS